MKGEYRQPTKLERSLRFTLEPELFERVERYHKASGHGRTGIETIRELIWLGLSAAPETAIVAAGRHWALRQAQQYVMRELSLTFTRIANELARGAQEAEANLKSDIQFALQTFERERERERNAG